MGGMRRQVIQVFEPRKLVLSLFHKHPYSRHAPNGRLEPCTATLKRHAQHPQPNFNPSRHGPGHDSRKYNSADRFWLSRSFLGPAPATMRIPPLLN